MQKRHRIFIAINLPGDIKKALGRYQQQWHELPATWVSSKNLHITLVFLGDLTDQELGEVCVVAKNIANQHQTFNVALHTIAYGPGDKLPPRMIWVGGEKSKELSLLENDLENALLEKIHFKPETAAFSPHITLARISTFLWRQIEPEERPEVNETIDSIFTVESIE